MSDTWIAIAALAGATFAIRAAGPLALGGQRVPERLRRALDVLPAAMLTALVVTQGFVGPGPALHVDARAAGLVTAAVASSRGTSMLTAVCLAAVATALVRLIGGQ